MMVLKNELVNKLWPLLGRAAFQTNIELYGKGEMQSAFSFNAISIKMQRVCKADITMSLKTAKVAI